MNSKVSVIIPTYNRANLVVNAVNSIISQSYGNWECIVVDDHSSDNTEEIVKSISNKDPRIKYLLNVRSKGAQGARNTGILASTGDWICFLDSDDLYYEKKLEIQLQLVTKKPEVDIVTCFSKVVHTNCENKITFFEFKTKGNILKALLSSKLYVDTNSALIRRSKLFEIGLLDEKCPSFQEWDTHIRLSEISCYDFVPEYLCKYLIHNGERISNSFETEIFGMIYLLKKHQRQWCNILGKDEYVKMIIGQAIKVVKSKWTKSNISLVYKILGIYPFYVIVFISKKGIKKILHA